FNNQKRNKYVHDENVKEEDFAHGGVKTGARATHDDRCGMLGAPPANGKKDQRNIEKGENAEESAEECAAAGLLDERTQEQVGNVKQPEHEGGSQAGIPGPPNAPNGMSPNGPGDENNGDAGQADFSTSDAEPVVLLTTLPDVKKVGHEADEENHLAGPGGGCVKIKDALNEAHGAFRGSHEEIGVGSRNQEQHSHGAEENAFCHHGSFLQKILAEKP